MGLCKLVKILSLDCKVSLRCVPKNSSFGDTKNLQPSMATLGGRLGLLQEGCIWRRLKTYIL